MLFIARNRDGVNAHRARYFEWVQNLQNFYWEEDDVNAKLKRQIVGAFNDVFDAREKYDCTFRVAAYIVALNRLVTAKKLRG